jgi:hypothetical protein
MENKLISLRWCTKGCGNHVEFAYSVSKLKDFIVRINFMCLDLRWSVLLTQYFSGDKIEKNEMGGACSAYGRDEKRVQDFGGEIWGKETTWESQA